jgi:hypothetical protein
MASPILFNGDSSSGEDDDMISGDIQERGLGIPDFPPRPGLLRPCQLGPAGQIRLDRLLGWLGCCWGASIGSRGRITSMQYIRARNNRPLLPTSLTEKTAGLDEDYDRLKGGKVARRPCLYALLGISLLFSVSATRMRAKHLAVILFRSSSRNMSERGAVTRRLAPYLAWKFSMTPPPVFLHQLCSLLRLPGLEPRL